jgi:Cu+-exporting ATPase
MKPLVKAAMAGIAAATALLVIYFGLLTLVSGWRFTLEQFAAFWPYVVTLAGGFGIQTALYLHLRQLVHGSRAHGKVVAASGATSTAAMVSCCTHYLANLLPVVGAAGLVTLATQYQAELFWVGLAFNAAGIAYIGSKVAAAIGMGNVRGAASIEAPT